MQNVSTCLWFDDQAEQAAHFYVGLFPNSRVLDTKRYLEGSPRPAGSVLTVFFSLDGTEYTALNGGPQFKLSPALSLVAFCDDQPQIDRLWETLGEGGHHGQCGWLTDRFGVTWQVVPKALLGLMNQGDPAASQRAAAAMMKMGKLDIAGLEAAWRGD